MMVSWHTCCNLIKMGCESKFSCLNLKPDDGFLPYNMPKVFNKTGHGLIGIVIARDEFKPVLHTVFLGIMSTVR